MKVLDLSQDFSMHTPAFATYTGPSIKWAGIFNSATDFVEP